MKFTVKVSSETKHVEASRFHVEHGFVIFVNDLRNTDHGIGVVWVTGSATVAAYPSGEVRSIESEAVSTKAPDDHA